MGFAIFDDFLDLLGLWNFPKAHLPLDNAIVIVVEIGGSCNKIDGGIVA